MAVSEVKDKCKVSKNKKKSWRKFTKIQDVEEYLDTKREDERMGGHPSQKSDDSLFVIAKEPRKENHSRILSKKERRNRPLKCYQNLIPSSHVPAITSTKPPLSSKGKKVWPKKRKLSTQLLPEPKRRCTESIYDLWDGEQKDSETSDTEVSDPEIVEHYRQSICKKRAVVPEHIYMKPSLLPSVEVPHPGASYNPGFVDHQELLLEAHNIEVDKEKKEQRIERAMAKKLVATESEIQKLWLNEMCQGLPFTEEKEEDDVSDSDEDTPAMLICKKMAKKKDKKKKRKELEQKKKEFEMKKQKEERVKLNDVFRIRSLKKEIALQNQKSLKRQEKKREKEIESLYKPKRLSKYKYEDPDKELKLSDELVESLRLLKPEGSLLEDRYKSLQRRNLIEPRIKQKMKRKYKLKAYIKRSHRD